VIARLLPCVDSGEDVQIAEDAFTAMEGERARLTADIDRLVEARAALDELIEGNTRYRHQITDSGR